MSFARKAATVAAAQVLGAAIGMVNSIISSRMLGPDGVGQLELLRQFSMLLMTCVTFGVNNAAIYFLNNRRAAADEVITVVFWFWGGLAVFVTCAATIIIELFPKYFGSYSPWFVIFYSAGVAALLGAVFVRSIMTAKLLARRIVVIDLLPHIALCLGLVALLFVGRNEPVWVIGTYSATCILLALVSFRYVSRQIRWLRRKHVHLIVQMAKYGAFLWSSNICLVLNTVLAVFLLQYFSVSASSALQFTDVGLFTRASAITLLCMLVPASIGPLLYSKWAKTADSDELRIQAEKACRLVTTYGLCCAVFLLFAGKAVISLLYGDAFIDAQDALVFLAPAVALKGRFNVYSNLLAATGKPGIVTLALIMSIVMLLAAGSCLIPLFGGRGAAISVLLANLISVGVTGWICHRQYGIRIARSSVLQPRDCLVIAKSIVDGQATEVGTP